MRGSHFTQLVAVLDQLRAPGGCPWDAEQTHQSLVEYLIEEAYESVEAIDANDSDAMSSPPKEHAQQTEKAPDGETQRGKPGVNRNKAHPRHEENAHRARETTRTMSVKNETQMWPLSRKMKT